MSGRLSGIDPNSEIATGNFVRPPALAALDKLPEDCDRLTVDDAAFRDYLTAKPA